MTSKAPRIVKTARRVVSVEALELRARRSDKAMVAGPRCHVSMAIKTPYEPERDLLSAPLRKGTNDAMGIPSRFGDRLHYRNGRKVDINTNQDI